MNFYGMTLGENKRKLAIDKLTLYNDDGTDNVQNAIRVVETLPMYYLENQELTESEMEQQNINMGIKGYSFNTNYETLKKHLGIENVNLSDSDKWIKLCEHEGKVLYHLDPNKNEQNQSQTLCTPVKDNAGKILSVELDVRSAFVIETINQDKKDRKYYINYVYFTKDDVFVLVRPVEGPISLWLSS